VLPEPVDDDDDGVVVAAGALVLVAAGVLVVVELVVFEELPQAASASTPTASATNERIGFELGVARPRALVTTGQLLLIGIVARKDTVLDGSFRPTES
jgi:hypothetical protein